MHALMFKVNFRGFFAYAWTLVAMGAVLTGVVASIWALLEGDAEVIGLVALGMGPFSVVAVLVWLASSPERNSIELRDTGLHLKLFDVPLMVVRLDIPYANVREVKVSKRHFIGLWFAWPDLPRREHVDLKLSLEGLRWRRKWTAVRLLKGDALHLDVMDREAFLDALRGRLGDARVRNA